MEVRPACSLPPRKSGLLPSPLQLLPVLFLLLAGNSHAASDSETRANLSNSTTAPTESTEAAGDAEAEHITVSARRREDPVLAVPVALSRFSGQSLETYDIQSFVDYATLTPSLSFAYGNGATAIGNARTIAIRGISGARTTGFYIDDTPLPGAVDVRIVDLDSIEILKGPQGTLFGESSLGGNIRLQTNAPDLHGDSQRYRLAGGQTQGADEWNTGAELMSNIVLEPDVAALRLVAFSEREAGYLSRSYRADIFDPDSPRLRVDNQGALDSRGGSVTAKLQSSEQLTTTLRLMMQQQEYYGFPASYASLPAFEPETTIEHTANIQPFVNDRWSLPSFSLRYDGVGWSLLASLSYFDRDIEDLEDSTEGTARYWGTTLPQGFAWTALHHNRQWSHETRLLLAPSAALSATVGIFYTDSVSDFDIPAIYGQLGSSPGASSLLWLSTDHTEEKNSALFGELYYRFLDDFTLTLGARQFWLEQDNELYFEILSTRFRSANTNRDSGLSPKLALSYGVSDRAMVYASAAEGFRAGGAQFDPSGFGCDADIAALGLTPAEMTRIKADTTRSYELGSKLQFAESGLLLTGALFHIDWDNIQQHLFLPSCGFYMQGNAGAADMDGAELELTGRVTADLSLRFGVGYQDARISEQGGTGQRKGDRIYQTPEWTASLAAAYHTALSDRIQGFVTASYSYTGDSVSANSGPTLKLVRAAYSLINLRLGLQWAQTELALNISNVGNENPNLGDIGYIGYQRYEADNVTPRPQVATLAPRTIMLQLQQTF